MRSLWNWLKYKLVSRWLMVLHLKPGDTLIMYDVDLMMSLSERIANPAFTESIKDAPPVRMVYVDHTKPLFTQLSFRDLTEIYNDAYAAYAGDQWETMKTNSLNTSGHPGVWVDRSALSGSERRRGRT